MVFFYECSDPRFSIYMGRDKYENEDLIRWGWPEDLWFHVDAFSSAHVYLRLPGDGSISFSDVPESVVQECAQLTKNNSIQGSKETQVRVVYTPWSNLKKTGSMDVGEVGFHDRKLCRFVKVERDKDIVKRIEKTKTEVEIDLEASRKQRDNELREEEKKRIRDAKAAHAAMREKELAEREERSYDRLFDEEKMRLNSNKVQKSAEEYEDDFM